MIRDPRKVVLSDRDLTAIQEGREIAGTFTLGYLIELASTLGLEPHELIVTGGVIAADAYVPPVRPWSSTLQPVIARDPCTGSTGVPDG